MFRYSKQIRAFFVLFVLLMVGPTFAAEITYYPPIPFTKQQDTIAGHNPPQPLTNTSGYWGSASVVPQAGAFADFFRKDGVMDAILVPSPDLQQTGQGLASTVFVSGACAGDLYEQWVQTLAPKIETIQKDIQNYGIPVIGFVPRPWTHIYNQCGTQGCHAGEACMALCLRTLSYRPPAACEIQGNPVLISDGEKDPVVGLGPQDRYLSDLQKVAGQLNTASNEILIAGLIPDPVDSFFSAYSISSNLVLPVDVIEVQLPGRSTPQAVILNRYPLALDYAARVKQLSADKQLVLKTPLISDSTLFGFAHPVPLLYATSGLQDGGAVDAPLFMMLDEWGDGVSPQQAGQTPKQVSFNLENECTTSEFFEWGTVDPLDPLNGARIRNPQNCLSLPVAVRSLDLNADQKQDLVVLHQDTYHREYRKNVVVAGQTKTFRYHPVWKDFCTNYDRAANQGNGTFLNGALSVKGPGYAYLSVSSITPPVQGANQVNKQQVGGVVTVDQQGYLTSYMNRHAGAAGEKSQASFFKRHEKDRLAPHRVCVGPNPVDLAVVNLGGSAQSRDLVVANYGEFDIGTLAMLLDPSVKAQARYSFAGGLTVLRGFDGEKADAYDYYPIRPSLTSDHPAHPVHVAVGDFNGDKKQDVLTTFMDGMGFDLKGGRKTVYQVPDIIYVNQSFGPLAPTAFHSSMACNGGTGPGCSRVENASPAVDAAATEPATFLAKYSNVNHFNEWNCEKIPEADELLGKNPANPGEDSSTFRTPLKHNEYSLYQCYGWADDGTCPEIRSHQASYFYYRFVFAFDGTNTGALDADHDGLESLPREWQKWCGPQNGNQFGQFQMTCDVPGFEKGAFQCEWEVAGSVSCRGKTLSRTVDPVIFRSLVSKNTPAETWALSQPVERDALYECGFDMDIGRRSEFAVYMNKGDGTLIEPSDASVGSNYVGVGKTKVPLILDHFPFNKTTVSDLLEINTLNCRECAVTKDVFWKVPFQRMTYQYEAGLNAHIGLGPWPFAVDCRDMVNKEGVPLPDGLDDCVVGFANSHYVGLFPSQGGLNPFNNTKMQLHRSSTKYHELMVNNYLSRVLPKKDLQPMDLLKIFTGMSSGATSVKIPKTPLNDLNVFGEPNTMPGISVIHAFPWKSMQAVFQGMLGRDSMQSAAGIHDYENK